MSDSALVMGTIYTTHSAPMESAFTANNAQEIVIRPATPGLAYMLASEGSLAAVWMTESEEEAWKDL